MYLVLSALTSSPISLVAATKASAFSFKVCIPPPSILTSSAYIYIYIYIYAYLYFIINPKMEVNISLALIYYSETEG